MTRSRATRYDAVARDTVASGALLRLFDITTLPVLIHSFACAETRAEDPMIRAFRGWFLTQADDRLATAK